MNDFGYPIFEDLRPVVELFYYKSLIDESACANDLKAVALGIKWTPFVTRGHFIPIDRHNEPIAEIARLPQQLDVPPVEQIEDPDHVNRFHHRSSFPYDSFKYAVLKRPRRS